MRSTSRPTPTRTPLVVRDRVVLEGPATLSEQELLALLLDPTGKSPAAWADSCRLLSECGDLTKLSRFRAEGLAKLGHISQRDAVRVLAALEIGRRVVAAGEHVERGRALTAGGVFAWARPRLGHLEHEEIWVLCVDARTRLRSTWQVGKGGLHGCAVLPRDILVPVVRDGAAAFVLVHNHPSGDPSPSPEDLHFTHALGRASATLAIPLLDHVVVTKDAYRSLLDAGQLESAARVP